MTKPQKLYPDEVPRPVTAVRMIETDYERTTHSHRKAQLILAIRGLVTCEVARGLWMVPPQCALWIPGGMEHSIRGFGLTELTYLFVEPASANGLPPQCCTLAVPPLLRELILELSSLPLLYELEGADMRLVDTTLDRLAAANKPFKSLHLPMPSDRRLRDIADKLMSEPADHATIHDWSRRIGMSERTLVRLVKRETGLGFGQWRKQFHIMFALERLSRGEPVQTVAFELGYESASAFITMFRKSLGKPPARFLVERREMADAAFENS